MPQSTIGQRLVILATVPLIALVVSAGTLVFDAIQSLQNARQSSRLLEFSTAAGNLVHTLQSERGGTAGFIQSKGTRFADTIPKMRNATDEKLAAFRTQVGNLATAKLPALATSLEVANIQLDRLASLRVKANAFDVQASETTAYFSETISNLIAVISSVVEYNNDANIGKKSAAHIAFMHAKEYAGQERALTTPAFVANKIEVAGYHAILERIHNQKAFLITFNEFAEPSESTALRTVLESPASREVLRLRAVMAERYHQGGFDVDSAAWFKAITEKIDSLYQVETLIAQNLNESATKLIARKQSDLITSITFAAIAIALTIVVAFWVGRGVSGPLTAAVAVAEQSVKRNDFTRKVPTEGATEVVRTAEAFNLLMDKFRTILTETSRSSSQIANAAEHLAISSSEITKGAEMAAESTTTVAAAVQEVSVSFSETAANASQVHDLIRSSSHETSQALDVMARAVTNIDAISNLILESSHRVEVLEHSSQQIGGIIQVIKEIADQTNLLALNAAIEAARAGEQGRGFAVVADEVRKLAERTASSTGEITSLVDAIRSHVGEAVVSMHDANAEATKNKSLVTESEAALRSMGESSERVVTRVSGISDAIREQDKAMQQVATNIERIAEMTEQSRAVALANAETAAQLDKLAGSLKISVSRFSI